MFKIVGNNNDKIGYVCFNRFENWLCNFNALLIFKIEDETKKAKRKVKVKYLVEKRFFQTEEQANDYSDKEIDFVCKWYLSNVGVDKMCNIILRLFRDNHRLLET